MDDCFPTETILLSDSKQLQYFCQTIIQINIVRENFSRRRFLITRQSGADRLK